MEEGYFSLFLNVSTIFSEEGVFRDEDWSLPEDSGKQLTLLPSYLDNGSQFQVYIQDDFINECIETIFNAGLLELKLDKIYDDVAQDPYIRLFLVNELDTNLISIFVPEIWDNANSKFVERDKGGKIRKDVSFPCEISISAYQESPQIKLT